MIVLPCRYDGVEEMSCRWFWNSCCCCIVIKWQKRKNWLHQIRTHTLYLYEKKKVHWLMMAYHSSCHGNRRKHEVTKCWFNLSSVYINAMFGSYKMLPYLSATWSSRRKGNSFMKKMDTSITWKGDLLPPRRYSVCKGGGEAQQVRGRVDRISINTSGSRLVSIISVILQLLWDESSVCLYLLYF